jgi:hypothetical protein
VAALSTVAGPPLELVAGGDLELSEDPNKSGSISASASATVTVFERTPAHPTGYAHGPTAISPTVGNQYVPGDPRTTQTTESTATITAVATTAGAITTTATSESTPAGRTARATPLDQTPTANSNGGTVFRQYPSVSNRMATELGGLPLERARIQARAEATQIADPVDQTFYGEVDAQANAAVNVAPVQYGTVATAAAASVAAAGYSFTPRVQPTGNAAGALTGAYPSLFELGARELGQLPLSTLRVPANGRATATVTAQVSSSGQVSATAIATVTPRAIEWAQVSTSATATVATAPAEFASLACESEATVAAHGAPAHFATTSADAQLDAQVGSFLIQYANAIQTATATVLPSGFARTSGTIPTSGAGNATVSGLRLDPGDGVAVPLGNGTRIALLRTDPTPIVYVPGPEIEPIPIAADPPYDPDHTMVAILTSASP